MQDVLAASTACFRKAKHIKKRERGKRKDFNSDIEDILFIYVYI